jgi:hypothetical protein
MASHMEHTVAATLLPKHKYIRIDTELAVVPSVSETSPDIILPMLAAHECCASRRTGASARARLRWRA